MAVLTLLPFKMGRLLQAVKTGVIPIHLLCFPTRRMAAKTFRIVNPRNRVLGPLATRDQALIGAGMFRVLPNGICLFVAILAAVDAGKAITVRCGAFGRSFITESKLAASIC